MEKNDYDNLINIREFSLREENQNEIYLIKSGLTKNKTNLIIDAYPKDNFLNYFYHIELNFNEFQNLSKGFKMCESLEEIYEIFQELFEYKKAKITKEGNNLIISLYIILLGGKEQKIDLILSQNNCNTNEINNELYNRVKYLEKEIKKLKTIEKILFQQREEIEELKKWKNKYDCEIENISKIKSNELVLNNIDLKILKTKEEIEFLEKRLKNNDKILLDKKINFHLLYRSSKDGNSEQSFHNKCDNTRGTLTIIKTTKGIRFGGYTEQIWNKNDYGRNDNKDIAFCFSLDLLKIYNHNNSHASYSIYCSGSLGPCFYDGGCYFFYTYFPLNKEQCYVNYTKGRNTFGKFEKDYEINNNQKYFAVQELEVFKIIFE